MTVREPVDGVVGYHVAEGVSDWNLHLMACLHCAPADVQHPDNAVTVEQSIEREYVCDTCERSLEEAPDEQ